jgi:L-ascorbate metabolism protein UlaG (beta-lactamase superfamily)
MTIFLVVLALAVAFIMLVTYFISAPRYKGPVSGHFNGKQFINPGGVKAKGLPDVFKWATQRKPGKWEPNPGAAYGERPPAEVTQGIRITFVNHSTFLIQFGGMNILTDPVWSERTSPFTFAGPKRMRPPGIRFEDLPRIDVVLLSHNHYDHLDIRTVVKINERFHPQFVQPLGVGEYLEENGIVVRADLDWWTSTTIDPITIHAVPAQHFSGRGTFDRDATLWCGYVINSKEGNIYFAGDSGYNPNTFKEIGNKFHLDLSIIPIGAYKPQWFMSPIHCSPEEAVQIHLDLKTKQSVASHFGTFPLADDGLTDPVDELRDTLRKRGVPGKDFVVLQEGVGTVFNFGK